jgi:hypothetical protein
MIRPQGDDRNPERRARDEQIAAEPKLPPLKVSPDALRTTLDAYLRARRTRRFVTVRPGHTQMVGGTNCVIATTAGASALDIGVRVVELCWPQVRFQDPVTGEKYHGYSEIPMGRISHLFAYRSADDEKEWMAGDVDVQPNTMLYLSRSPNGITLALDDANAVEMRSMVESLRSSLTMDILNNFAEAA